MTEWQPIETVPRGKRVEARTCRGETIRGRTPPSGGQVRDVNTIVGPDGMRHVCTHWRTLPTEQAGPIAAELNERVRDD